MSKHWRRDAGQGEVSLWAVPVLEAEEMLVFAPGRRFAYQRLQDLRGRSIATVRGYGYVGCEYFQRHGGADVQALIHLVAQGRSEAGILDRLEWRYLQHEHAMLQGGSLASRAGADDQSLSVASAPASAAGELVGGL
ncbi:hypothetical protein QDX81_15400 [Pseudomonas sp. CW003PS]|nr:hypothetical protein QDX81_15400 [Pseudomonas sp. CW003PS]